MKKKIYIALLLSCAVLRLQAQVALTAGTQSHTTPQGTHHQYVIGEMSVVHTSSNGNLQATQGYLQPIKVQSIVPSKYLPKHAALVNVYPNPATNSITVNSTYAGTPVLLYTINDAQGKVIYQQQVTGKQNAQKQVIDLAAFAIGNYFIKVNNITEGLSITYKIIKQ
jgi:hypothetical protein